MHPWHALLLQAERPLPGGYGVALVQSLLALVAVCVLAWVVLRVGAKAGLGIGRGEHLEVVERMALDARRSVVVVRVGKRMLLLGVGEGAAPQLLTELDPRELPSSPRAKVSFLEVLRRPREVEPPKAPEERVENPSENPPVADATNEETNEKGAA